MYEPGFSDGPGFQGISLLPSTSETGWRATTVAPTPLRLTTSSVASTGRWDTRSRIAPARVESLRGLIVANRAPVADERLAGIADA